jgi:parafibromin
MSSSIDPLLALRQTIKSKVPITYSNGTEPTSSLVAATHIVLSPALLLPKSSPTRYRKTGVSTSTEPSSNPGDFFSLEAVYLAWLLRDAPGAEYMKQARENGLAVGFVSVTERKNVVDWLEGRIADHEKIIPLIGEQLQSPVLRVTAYLGLDSGINDPARNASTLWVLYSVVFNPEKDYSCRTCIVTIETEIRR